jgi:hypothetical protein
MSLHSWSYRYPSAAAGAGARPACRGEGGRGR